MKRTVLAFACLWSTAAFASPSSDLSKIIDDHLNWATQLSPSFARALGLPAEKDGLEDLTLEQMDRTAQQAAVFAKRLRAIPDQKLTQAERTNKGVLLSLLDDQVETNRFGQRMMLFTTYAGWHQSFADMPEGFPFRNAADYQTYLKILGAYPAQNGAAIDISRKALAQGYIQPCVALNGFENTINGVIPGKAEESRFFAPFRKNRPADMSEADWTQAKAEALRLIDTVLRPEYQKFHDFYVREYKPKCRKTVGISEQPGGAAYYAYQAKVHTTTDLTPEQIHSIGLKEVARIRARMDDVAAKAGFASRQAMIAEIKSNPKYFAKTPAELMAAAAATAKQIDGLMPGYFKTLPRLPYGIRSIPAETAETTTTAYYNPGKPELGLAGNYYVNTSKLNQRPLWELPALTAHEAVPGHHHQIALQQELDMPVFRRYLAGYTAFVEGWALYTEYLGEEMGLYDTPEKMMGRLSYEMWRANRLVVDTGMHAKGWSKEQALAFMRDNTALTEANIEAEVNRYISWPGQALGYKIGEMKIRELRAKAEKALGSKFNLSRFHDAVLTQGAIPLTLLEQQIDAWIALEKKR